MVGAPVGLNVFGQVTCSDAAGRLGGASGRQHDAAGHGPAGPDQQQQAHQRHQAQQPARGDKAALGGGTVLLHGGHFELDQFTHDLCIALPDFSDFGRGEQRSRGLWIAGLHGPGDPVDGIEIDALLTGHRLEVATAVRVVGGLQELLAGLDDAGAGFVDACQFGFHLTCVVKQDAVAQMQSGDCGFQVQFFGQEGGTHRMVQQVFEGVAKAGKPVQAETGVGHQDAAQKSEGQTEAGTDAQVREGRTRHECAQRGS